jgi:type II secretory pathway pseudopilin PulG
MSHSRSLVPWIVFLLVIGIVIAITIPQYQYISTELRKAKARHVAAALSNAAASNYVARRLHLAEGISIGNCQEILKLRENPLPAGYTIPSKTIAADVIDVCQLQGTSGPMLFNVIGTR